MSCAFTAVKAKHNNSVKVNKIRFICFYVFCLVIFAPQKGIFKYIILTIYKLNIKFSNTKILSAKTISRVTKVTRVVTIAKVNRTTTIAKITT